MKAIAIALLIVSSATAAPRHPLKNARTLHTAAEIAQARENVKKYPSAKALAEKIAAEADQWVKWKDEDLVALLADSRVPRAFDVAAGGCPVCGHKAYEKFGTYPWIIDPKVPFKIKCPIDGTVFPTNDYDTYYKSGFTEKKGWDSKYVDEGRGWVSPSGEKFWFVAYYNHWMWHKHLVPGLHALAQAYLLTGDSRYAHKAAVMLHRIAEVYPGMDHAKQSRYGELMAARGIDYPGKVVNHIWETQLAQNVAASYDHVWETIDGDAAIQKETGKTGEQIRAFIEANFLEDAIDAYFQGKIRGNFGMHQSCLITLGLVRQFGEQDKWFGDLLNRNDGDSQTLGLNYALYNLVYRDGFPDESSPGYNSIWTAKFCDIGELLARTGRDLFAQRKLKSLCDAMLDQHVLNGKYTPCIGDTGSYQGDLIGQNAQLWQIAYRHYKDPRYAQWLEKVGATGDKGFATFESLFYPPIEPSVPEAPLPSRLLDGYGQGILNNPKDSAALSIYYGYKGGHGHFDRLNIDVFSDGVPITPDLGYPDAMNDFVPGIYTWSKNTISHNTVTVDAQRQLGNAPGTVQLFVDSPFARALDTEAKETYPQCSSFRRNIIMVDADADHSYYVDVFTVVGGKQHDYSLHGPPGKFEMIGGQWSMPAEGTLAGKDVPLGQIYDDPKLAAKGYKGGFGSYKGSGFQHLFHVQEHEADPWVVQWTHENKAAHLRVRIFDQPGQRVMLCDAQVSPVRTPKLLKYVIARRQGNDLSSRFVSIIEPYGTNPLIMGARQLSLDEGNGVAVAVERANAQRDLILYGPDNATKKIAGENLVTDAREAVVTLDAQGSTSRVFHAGGTFLEINGKRFDAPAAVTGKVIAADRERSLIRVHPDSSGVDESKLFGRVVHFTNDLRRTAHPIVSATREGEDLVLKTRDELAVGRARIESVKGDVIATKTPLPLGATYRGVSVAPTTGEFFAKVGGVDAGKIRLGNQLPADHPFKAGDELWLINVGTGDRLDVPSVLFTSQGN